MFRSEDIVLLRVYFQRTAAHDCVEELGRRGLVEFRDLNANTSALQRTFAAELKLCDELQRKLRFLSEQANKYLPSEKTFTTLAAQSQQLIEAGPGYSRVQATDTVTLEDLNGQLRRLEADLEEMNLHWDALQSELITIREHGYVLELGEAIFSEARTQRISVSQYGTLPLLESNVLTGEDVISERRGPPDDSESAGQRVERGQGQGYTPVNAVLNVFAGTIAAKHLEAFSRMVFRVSRGNCFLRWVSVPEPIFDIERNESVAKTVFVLFFPGQHLRSKLTRICEGFGATRYPFPDSTGERDRLKTELVIRRQELEAIIETTQRQRADVLGEVATNVTFWTEKVAKEKAIYFTLDKLNYDVSERVFVGECWCPRAEIEEARAAIHIGDIRSNAQAPSIMEECATDEAPPTFFRCNRFTAVWQDIVEAYGIAAYKEMNPAPWSIATFPFLFAIMFGDVGHGMLMTVAALYVVFRERQWRYRKLGDLLQTMYDGRYLILMMGVFSMFTGLIYNECFGVPINLFGSTWKWVDGSAVACGIDHCEQPKLGMPPKRTYPFGFDPAWKIAENSLTMLNSFKMKMSIGFAVAQMTLGIILSYSNARYFAQSLDIWHVFVPQILFFLAIFGYLLLLIFLKWSTDWNAPGASSPPDLKAVLIAMFMSPGSLPRSLRLFPGQHVVQLVLLAIAIVTVPWMLLAKPLVLRRRMRTQRPHAYTPLHNGDRRDAPANLNSSEAESRKAEPHESAGNFAEIFVNNMIHTIEFVLGAISNTASYLRLWALSLAHAELTDVFLQKILYTALATENVIATMIGFVLWFGLTVGVLMLMESLSAFLHALRLHWVEFQNKFYNIHGSGVKFTPLRL
jgi:V-type H+-transporting ATPase subunit a